ncbi:MAG: ectonucleotide pyrophosphatase/phosphodiesterase [Treponema sp.]|nr:ectonucleotide pyrophosphatase/phosphodiesterase [Treponema sp.]
MNKLLVFCIDALCTYDLEQMSILEHFAPFFMQGSNVVRVQPVYPSMTYSCHTSILTGTYVNKHGIEQNENVVRGKLRSPWYVMKKDVKVPTLLDLAKERGRVVCSLSWPVSGAADYDFNMPMIVPYNYTGDEPDKYLRGKATDNLLDAYWWKFGRFLKGKDRSLDHYTMALAPEIIRDFGQPDVMLIKLCDLDNIRHNYGVYSREAAEQLRKHNHEFGVIVDAVRRYGDYEATNFVVLGDHGQTDVEDVLNMNALFKDHGFIRLNESGGLESYDALCHSVGMSAWIELYDPDNQEVRQRVYNFLLSLQRDPRIKLKYIFNKEEAESQFGLTGPFDYVIESERGLSFWEGYELGSIFTERVLGDKVAGNASHGGLPFKEETTSFLAYGPSIKQGVSLEHALMVDEAPTMARMLGFDMPNVDGRVLTELLKD